MYDNVDRHYVQGYFVPHIMVPLVHCALLILYTPPQLVMAVGRFVIN